LKVRRPKDWRPADIEPVQNLSQAIIPTGMEGPNKIFIGGLPAYLNEDQVKELLSSFGQLKTFNLVKETASGQSKGYAFFEYADTDVTDKACAGLNGMKLGEKNIVVQRATLGSKQNLSVSNPYTSSLLQNPTALNFLNLGMPIAAACALLGITISEAGPPTRIVQLGNMISPEDVEFDEDYPEIEEEVSKEASKYGTVLSVWIPRYNKEEQPLPQDENLEDRPRRFKMSWGFGRVFVEYKRKEDAKRAQESFAGRKFCNRQIVSGFFSEERYAMKNFEPDANEESDYANRIARQFGHDPDKDLSEEIPDDA